MNNQQGVRTRFKLTDQSLAPPPGVNDIPMEVMTKLKNLVGKGFPTEETFLAEVATVVSADELKRCQDELVRRADTVGRLILTFSTGPVPELLETRFYHAQFAPWGRHCVRGKDEGAHAGSGSFQWSPALKVLATYLLGCAASGRRGSNGLCPTLAGERSSPAASLNYAMSKKPEWIKDMFGEDSESHPYLLDLIRRTNPDLKRPGPVTLCLDAQSLPPGRIYVVAGDREVDGAEEIEQMARSIEASLKPNGSTPARFKVTIEGELEACTPQQLEDAFKEALAKKVKITNVKIIAMEHGSIQLTLELPPEDAERLFWAVHAGELDNMGVIGGEHVSSPFMVLQTATVPPAFSAPLEIPAEAVGRSGHVQGDDRLRVQEGRQGEVTTTTTTKDGLVLPGFLQALAASEPLLAGYCRNNTQGISENLKRIRSVRAELARLRTVPEAPPPEDLNRLLRRFELAVSVPAWDDLLQPAAQFRSSLAGTVDIELLEHWAGKVEALFAAVERHASDAAPLSPQE